LRHEHPDSRRHRQLEQQRRRKQWLGERWSKLRGLERNRIERCFVELRSIERERIGRQSLERQRLEQWSCRQQRK
jgi:hypothetical protein